MAVDPIVKIQNDLKAGKATSAFKKARIEAKKAPGSAQVQNLAGICAAEAGDHAGAAPYFNRAVKLAPANIDFRCNLVQALIMSGQSETAETLIDQALATTPSIARLHYMRAMIHMRASEFREAIAAADIALSLSPQMTEARNIRGNAKSALNQTAAALADFQEVLRLKPGNLLALQNCGERLNELGRTQDAVRHFRTILQIVPRQAFALNRLAELVPEDQVPDIAREVDGALSQRIRDQNELALLHMAKGTALYRSGMTEQAMDSYTSAHDIDARQRRYLPSEEQRSFDRIRNLFADMPVGAAASVGPQPLFVVGLPRSGTTLVEMILSRAPGVAACGELVAADQLYRDMFQSGDTVSAQALKRFGERYRDALPELPAHTTAFVDKMPPNYRLLGLLLGAFPDARVIHIERDPRDIAMSLWVKRFSAPGMAFATRLSWIAHEANLYKRYMQMWVAACPEAILTLRYEDIVRDMDTATRQMAAHCGIDWTTDMMRPDLNVGAVKTASVNQVRDKVHTRSIQKWGVLGARLTELTDALDPELWHLSAP